MGIFEFTFNPYALLSLLGLVTNVVVIYLIATSGYQVLTNRLYILEQIAMVLWSGTETLVRLSANPQTANFWYLVGAPGWLLMSPLFLSFVIAYVGKEKFLSSINNLAILFFPGFLLLFFAWRTSLLVNPDPSLARYAFWGWDTFKLPLFGIFMIWLDALYIISLVLLVRFRSKTEDPIKHKQATLIILGILVPVIVGSFTNGFLPVLRFEILPLAVPLTTIMSVMISYAILRYKLFTINPSMVVTNIVRTMNEILIVFNPRHYIDFVNDAVENILGYKKEDITGQHLKKLLGSEWENFEKKVLEPVDLGKQVSGVEINLETSKGEKIPVSFSSSVFKDEKGEIFAEVGVATDIRKTRRLIVDTIAERNKLTAVMQSIVDGVFALDLSGKIILVNPAAINMLGLEGESVIGKTLDDFLIMTDGNQELCSKDFLPPKKLAKDTVILQKDSLKITSSSGKQIFVNLTSSGIKEGNEVGLGAIITVNDVSKERELEEMKIDFVSMAAHELRTPITSARGYLSLIQEEGLDKLSTEQKSYIEKAFIASTQLASLVDNLLAVSRIERGAVNLQIVPCSWSKIVKDCVNNFRPLAQEKKIKLSINIPQNLQQVLADEFRISEVLSNILANALAYTKAGGSVKVEIEVNDKEIVTHVSDTGIGIPTEALPKLFTKFFRVSGALEQGSKGTGLGLYISKAIVEMHHGKIWVESKLGVGSIFSFSVPAARANTKKENFPTVKATSQVGAGKRKYSGRSL